MARAIAVVGASSSIGSHPYEDGAARHLNLAPDVLRQRGLVTRLRAVDLGDVTAPIYKDFERPQFSARNEPQVAAYSFALSDRVTRALANGQFAVVVGGDCSVVLGCLLAARQKARDALGLLYVDAHADFALSQESTTGSVAGMALALATGRGRTPLAMLGGSTALVDVSRAALLGRRDGQNAAPGLAALTHSGILDIPASELQADDWLEIAATVTDRVSPPNGRGFWIQLDVDVLNPIVMGAVDSPEPGGPTFHELVRVLRPLVRHPRALGMSLTSYDPALDPDRSGARQLVAMLETLLSSQTPH